MTAQAVEAAKKISSEFVDDVDSDGLLGLAFDSLNTGKAHGRVESNLADKSSQYRQTRRRPFSSMPNPASRCRSSRPT